MNLTLILHFAPLFIAYFPLTLSLPLFSYPTVSLSSFPFCCLFILLLLFALAVTGKPFFVVSSFSHRWLFGWEGCRFYGWAGFFFGCGSLITMTVVSLDRYLKICHIRYGKSGAPVTMSLKLHTVISFSPKFSH